VFPQTSTASYVQPGDTINATGVGYAIAVETGKPVSVYVNDTPPPVPILPAQPPVIIQQAPRDPWLGRIIAGTGGAALVIGVTGAVAPQLQMVGHALEMGGVGLGVLAAGGWLLKGTSPRVTVTNNVTVTGSSSTSSASASSAAGWTARSS